jgi:hypothetical protein
MSIGDESLRIIGLLPLKAREDRIWCFETIGAVLAGAAMLGATLVVVVKFNV